MNTSFQNESIKFVISSLLMKTSLNVDNIDRVNHWNSSFLSCLKGRARQGVNIKIKRPNPQILRGQSQQIKTG